MKLRRCPDSNRRAPRTRTRPSNRATPGLQVPRPAPTHTGLQQPCRTSKSRHGSIHQRMQHSATRARITPAHSVEGAIIRCTCPPSRPRQLHPQASSSSKSTSSNQATMAWNQFEHGLCPRSGKIAGISSTVQSSLVRRTRMPAAGHGECSSDGAQEREHPNPRGLTTTSHRGPGFSLSRAFFALFLF